jgi:tetratricopeptide (TPR) repeat protein
MMRSYHFGMLLLLVAGNATAAETFKQQLAELEAKLAAEPTNATILFKLGDLRYDEGARDNAKAVELAENYFKQLLAIEPTNAFASALLGSTLTMRARDAFWPKTRLDYAKKGNKMMDDAVQLAPEDPDVRLVRAINSFHMPKFMERDEIAKADFTWLWQRVETKPERLKDDLKQNVALFYGRILRKQKRMNEAIEVWNKGIAFNPGSDLAREMRQQLK